MTIEQLLELDDISLMPAVNTYGRMKKAEFNYGVTGAEGINSLPIFTAPNKAIVDKTNFKTWENSGIRVVLPRDEDLGIRLDGCSYIFTAFSLAEVQNNFLRTQRQFSGLLKICIETEDGDGGDINILNTANALKKMYGNRVCIMAGNIGNPKTYLDYCRAGIDYARVGLRGASCREAFDNGFYYPIVSMLLDINGLKATNTLGKFSKIVAEDVDIETPVEILKILALKADYVMLDTPFIKLVDAAGPVYRREKIPGEDFKYTDEQINPDAYNLLSLTPTEIRELEVKRQYDGEWIKVSDTLESWLRTMYEKFEFAFGMSNSTKWEDFKNNIGFRRI